MSYLRRKTTVSWERLRFQLGSQCADNRFGRAKFAELFGRHLAPVLLVYPDANVDVSAAGGCPVTIEDARPVARGYVS